MKYISFTSLVFSVFLLQNCNKKSDGETQKLIHTIEIQKDFLLGDSPELQFEMLDTINLDAPGNPPLTAVQDIAFSQDFFLLVDNKQGLLKFDYSGNFLLSIGEKGEGPEEYIMPYTIHLDEDENSVLVADWQKRIVISYDLEGNFNTSSQRLPAHPISFYKDNDTLLVVQETLNGTKEKPRQVLVSSIAPKTLEFNDRKSPLYGYNSRFTIIHSFPKILSRVNEASLFYLPIIRGKISSHSNADTIFKKVEDHLVPEYLLNFTGFDNADQLGITHVVLSDNYAYLRVLHNHKSYLVVVDLVNNRPLTHCGNLFDRELAGEIIPRPLNGDVFYSILRDEKISEEDTEEKNPLIVLYQLEAPVRNNGKVSD